ncbi:MAG: methylated-DNA--[protein]-cysteine S-methyltransferase [Syntrophomonadaceae bacterium]|nr:methylated-DNA--[protein]-cysteine S-methyltransferase [Syntrophomonadaceae bacterium]
MNALICATDIGPLVIAENGRAITQIFLPGEAVPTGYKYKDTGLLKEAALQLQAYFSGTLKTFSVAIDPQGTRFMQQVWASLQQIPYGETRSYRDIAVSIGNPRACRAVGQANNRNPIPILIPCHRVIGANGQLVGYGGGIHMKKYLLDLEKEIIC